MKSYYFLLGMPRSGNTLLGSIINQNPEVSVTANTILTDIIYQIDLIKDYLIYQNFINYLIKRRCESIKKNDKETIKSNHGI